MQTNACAGMRCKFVRFWFVATSVLRGHFIGVSQRTATAYCCGKPTRTHARTHARTRASLSSGLQLANGEFRDYEIDFLGASFEGSAAMFADVDAANTWRV